MRRWSHSCHLRARAPTQTDAAATIVNSLWVISVPPIYRTAGYGVKPARIAPVIGPARAGIPTPVLFPSHLSRRPSVAIRLPRRQVAFSLITPAIPGNSCGQEPRLPGIKGPRWKRQTIESRPPLALPQHTLAHACSQIAGHTNTRSAIAKGVVDTIMRAGMGQFIKAIGH